MTRFVNALLVFLMVLSAAAVYDMKYEAEIAAEGLASLEQQIANETAELSLLKAEWSVLTQPSRLQELVDRHQAILELRPLTADQIGSLADIPEKPILVQPEVMGPLEATDPSVQRSAQVGDDPSATVGAPAMVR